MTRKFSLFYLLFLTFALSSCAVFFNSSDGPEGKSDEYSVAFQNSSWKTISPDKSDMAFINKNTNSIIVVNSLCKKYEASALTELTLDALADINKLVIEEQEKINFQDREALRTHARGKMDGVPVYLIIQTLKKNRCIYDLSLISTSKNNRNKDKMDFNNFLNSITIK